MFCTHRLSPASAAGSGTPWQQRLRAARVAPVVPPPPPRAPDDAPLLDGETPPIVLMLRRPRERVVSAFFDGRRTDCQEVAKKTSCRAENIASNQRLRATFNGRNRSMTHDEAEAARVYAEWPGLRGCYTKLLNGRSCTAIVDDDDGATRNNVSAARAIARLRHDAAFVGLAEHWDLSVCLFGAMFGGAFAPHAMLHNYRPRNERAARAEALLPEYVDELDDAVYAEGERIFAAQLRRYGPCVRGELCEARLREHGGFETSSR